MQRVGLVNGRGAAFHVMDVGAFVDDDQGPLELAHVLGVDTEIGLQRDFHLHALRHVNERAAGPYRRVERGELVVARRDHRAEVLPEQIRLLPQRGVRVEEDDALFLEVFPDLVVDDLGLVLRGDARDKPLLFRLGDAEPVVGVLDVGGQLVPARRLLLGGADEILDVVEVNPGQVGAPGGQRLAAVVLQALQPHVEHPLRLVLPRRDVADHLFGQAAARGRARHVRVGPAELVRAQPFELVLRGGRHIKSPPDSVVISVGYGSVQHPAAGLPSRDGDGDVRGADAVAVRDRSEPLHRRAEQPAERLGFRLAQLRELGRHVRDRAVMLAQLLAAAGTPIAGAGPAEAA